MKMTEKKLRTRNVFMMKKIVDDENVEGGMHVVGTFIQQVFDLTEEQAEENDFTFDYRFNENSANDDTLVKRRTEPVKTHETVDGVERVVLGARTTFDTQIPFLIETLFTAFPFRIVTATITVELSSSNKGDRTFRPDLLLSRKDCRHNIAIQNLKPNHQEMMLLDASGAKPKKNLDITALILDKIDKTKKYDFISPYPKVYFEYEKKKDYAPRFVLSFYCITSGFKKFVSIILPMFLVTFITTINVANDDNVINEDTNEKDGEETSNHLQVMSALTLTAVFILPEILDSSSHQDSSLLDQDNIYVIMNFAALVLASVPKKIVGTLAFQTVGCALMWVSLLIPFLSYIRFRSITRRIKRERNILSKNERFLGDKDFKNWKVKEGLDEFSTVGEILKQDGGSFKDMYKVRKEEGFHDKYRRLWWNIPGNNNNVQ